MLAELCDPEFFAALGSLQKRVLEQHAYVPPVFNSFYEAAIYEVLEVRRVIRMNSRDRIVQDLDLKSVSVFLKERRQASRTFVRRDAQRPYIHRLRVRFPVDYLRCQPTNCTQLSIPILTFFRKEDREPKVGQLYITVSRNEHVVRFNVPVQYVPLVKCMHSTANAIKQVFAGLFREQAKPVLNLINENSSQFAGVHIGHEKPYSIFPIIGI